MDRFKSQGFQGRHGGDLEGSHIKQRNREWRVRSIKAWMRKKSGLAFIGKNQPISKDPWKRGDSPHGYHPWERLVRVPDWSKRVCERNAWSQSFNMASSREYPLKTLPKCLLMDLRRKGIWVPPELQMTIMYLKEVAETRDKKKQVTEIIRQVPVCDVFHIPQSLWDSYWIPTCIRTAGCQPIQNEASCHWCKKFFSQMLSIGMRAEMTRETPNLHRLYNQTGWLTMELYRHKTNRTSTGLMLCQTIQRPAHLARLWIGSSCPAPWAALRAYMVIIVMLNNPRCRLLCDP